MKKHYDIKLYDYDLPRDRIALKPVTPRDSSRLLVLEKDTGALTDSIFTDLPGYLKHDDLIVINDTKVFPARLIGYKRSGGKAEVFLLEKLTDNEWIALVKPGRRLSEENEIIFADDFKALITKRLPDGRRKVRLNGEGNIWQLLDKYGHTPLPVYIDREDRPEDVGRYQTVYASKTGAVAAPTAGFHFTKKLIDRIRDIGVEFVNVTLHVGWGTFRGIDVDDIRDHRMHSEYFEICEETAAKINKAKEENRRIICVGTTTVRTLESAAIRDLPLLNHSAKTELFISPGFEFKITDAMITNFHLPKSSLIVMVSAFADREKIMQAYRHAIEEKYRFYSYGDAMLII